MKASKAQHTLPRFYLEHFLQPGWVYLCRSEQPKYVHSARNVSVQNWYYSQPTEGNEYSLDDINTKIESETAPTFRKLLATKAPLSDSSKLLLSYFIANLAVRTPTYIKETGEIMVNALEQVDHMVKRIVEKTTKEVKEDEPYVNTGSHTYTLKE